MERPQNGVNGNIPQSNYGYIPTYMSTTMPRGNAQNVYSGYDNMSQVISNQFMTPGYTNIPHNVGNQIRPMSPQFIYSNYGLIPAQYSQYQPYSPAYQFTYPQEIQPTQTKPTREPHVPRKFSPLLVVDPTSNTGVDLSRFNSNTEKSSTSNVLQISEPNNVSKSHSKDQLIEKEDFVKTVDSKHESIEKGDTNIENPIDSNDCILSKTNEIKDSNENKIPESEFHIDLEINKEETISNLDIEENVLNITVEIEKDSSTVDLEEKESDNNEDIEENECNIKTHKEEEFNNKNNEETNQMDSNVSLSNYHLLIDKKESDETTLKKKLIYDREYLIKFKDIGKSRQRPLKMPQTSEFSEDIISNTPRIISCQLPDTSSNQINIEKNIKKQSSNRQYLSQGHKMYNRQPERKHIHLEISNNQTYIRTKSGYLPPQFRDKQKENNSRTDLIRNIKSNLNKITPQNFQNCLTEIEKLNIDNQEEMSCLINEIFIKAVKEEAYSVTYAQFCNKLATMYSENQSFKSQLLKKCQDMFETPLKDQLSTVKTDWELKISNETDLKMKVLYESDLDEQVKKAKDKYFGNIRFIGELFLHNLLAAKVIINCIKELLTGHEEPDAMLALCKLLETCGKQIDTKHKEQMNGFIQQILCLSQSRELEKRIRFKLRDIVDMRDRGWTLRHVQQEKQINPKTLQEQKEEAEAEALAAATKFAAMTKKKNFQNLPSNNSRRNVPMNPSNKQLHFTELTCNIHPLDEKTVLGPVGTKNWISGSGSKPNIIELDSGWTAVGSQKQKNTAARYASNSRSREQSPQVSRANKFRTLESSAEASGADSRSSTPPLPYQKAHRVKIKESELVITDDVRADIIFAELLSSNQFDMKSWMQLRNTKRVIEKWIDDMMEKDIKARQHIGDAFNQLLLQKNLTPDQIVEGTQTFVGSIDDLICDIPKLWSFFAEFLERFIHDKNSNISFFENIFKSMVPNLNVAHCFSTALHMASSRLGHNIVGQVFHRSMKWNQIISEDLEHFIKENKLEFTCDGGAPLSPHGGEPLDLVAKELDDMLSNNCANENIFEFLETHIDKPTWKNSECTRTVTSSILKAIKRIPETSVREYFKIKMEIIKRISKRKTDHEFGILISILHAVPDLSNDTLILIYDLLITDGIVSLDTLQKYLNDKSLQSESNYKLTLPIISQLYSVNEKR